MRVVRRALRPTTTKTVAAAVTALLAWEIAEDPDFQDDTREAADIASFLAWMLTIVYGLLSFRPSRGRARAITSGALATGAGLAGFQIIRGG